MTDTDRKTLESLADRLDMEPYGDRDTAAIRAALAEIDRLRKLNASLAVEVIGLEHARDHVAAADECQRRHDEDAREIERLRAALAKGDADNVNDWRRFARAVVGDYADSHGADACEAEYLRLHAQRTEDAAAFARDEIAALRARNTRLAETVEIARELVQYDWLDSLDDSDRSNDVRRDVARLDAQFRATTTKETP